MMTFVNNNPLPGHQRSRSALPAGTAAPDRMRRLSLHAGNWILIPMLAIFCSFGSSLRAQVSPCGIDLASSPVAVYPPIAKAAHVSGDVVLLVSINRDGTIAATRVLSGPEMLKMPALNFMAHANAGVSEGSRKCAMTLNFSLIPVTYDDHCIANNLSEDRVTQADPQHVSITSVALGCCDPAIHHTRHHFLFFHWNRPA